jgi:hypothetical protein
MATPLTSEEAFYAILNMYPTSKSIERFYSSFQVPPEARIVDLIKTVKEIEREQYGLYKWEKEHERVNFYYDWHADEFQYKHPEIPTSFLISTPLK